MGQMAQLLGPLLYLSGDYTCIDESIAAISRINKCY